MFDFLIILICFLSRLKIKKYIILMIKIVTGKKLLNKNTVKIRLYHIVFAKTNHFKVKNLKSNTIQHTLFALNKTLKIFILPNLLSEVQYEP